MVLASNVDELNFLASRLETLSTGERAELNAALQAPQSELFSIGRITDFPENVEYYVYLPDVRGPAQLGDYYLSRSGMVDTVKVRAFRASQTMSMFISLVRKYTRAKKLTPRMLNELVEKIEVFNAEKVNGVWEQRLRIHYNCVGTIEIPSALPLPTPDVSVNTRKGVVVNYAPCDVAI